MSSVVSLSIPNARDEGIVAREEVVRGSEALSGRHGKWSQKQNTLSVEEDGGEYEAECRSLWGGGRKREERARRGHRRGRATVAVPVVLT